MSRTLKNWEAPARTWHRMILALAAMWIPGVFLWLLMAWGIPAPPPLVTFLIWSAMILIFQVWACLETRLAFRVRNLLRHGREICFECGYRIDNVGPTSEQCPECGCSIEESKVRTEKWVEKNLRFCFWPFTLLEPRSDDDGEPPT